MGFFSGEIGEPPQQASGGARWPLYKIRMYARWMISLRFDTDRLHGAAAGIYRFRGRFQLFVDDEGEENDDPALEGNDARELEAEARRLGATSVTHWYDH
jgi:hypothetical protein